MLIRLENKIASTNSLQFGKGNSYRTANYHKSQRELVTKFQECGIIIDTDKAIQITFHMYYPIPKSVNVKKRPYPTKRSTGDIDNIKILFDSLMLATKESWKNKKEKPLFDDSQVVDLVVQQRYWSESDYGLDVSYKILEEGEDTWEKMNK